LRNECPDLTSLALDHLTVADTTPAQLVEVAARAGCRAVCLFLTPMAVLPRMPQFALIGDTAERRETRRRCEDLGITIDLAYPFTLAGRTEIDSFRPAMETAAWLGVRALNTLVYDRDPQRRRDRFGQFCELAGQYALSVALEFYPASQVRTLQEAIALVELLGQPSHVGVNLDLLHLIRSGGQVAQVAAVAPDTLQYAQYCDGPENSPTASSEWEASRQRLLPGQGVFDVRGFAAALPERVRCSVEIPQEDAIEAGVPALERALRAVTRTHRAIEARDS